MANEGEIGHAFRTPAGAFRFRVKHLAEYLERAAQMTRGLGDKGTR